MRLHFCFVQGWYLVKLIFLGSGSAFTVGANNYHSNMLLQSEEGKRFLIDCGGDVRHALFEVGLSYKDITDVYISHLHADHTGGLEWLAFNTRFDKDILKKPHLYINEVYLPRLWKNTLSGGLDSLSDEYPSLSSYFEIHPLNVQRGFTWNNIQFQMIQTKHVHSNFCCMPSFGLFFTIDDINIFITSDTQFDREFLLPYYQNADIIFHDCETQRRTGVHAHYQDLCKLEKEIKNKMWLYHYQPGELPNAKADGFLGFVHKGQAFDFSQDD